MLKASHTRLEKNLLPFVNPKWSLLVTFSDSKIKPDKLSEYWSFQSYMQLHCLVSLKIILVNVIKHRNRTANSLDSVFLHTNVNWERWSEINWVTSWFVLMTIRIWLKYDHLLKYMNYEFQNKTKSLPTEGNCEKQMSLLWECSVWCYYKNYKNQDP